MLGEGGDSLHLQGGRVSSSCVNAMAVTPSACASEITNFSFPDSGKKARIFPSFQPDRMVLPDIVMPTQEHSRFGTCTTMMDDNVEVHYSKTHTYQ